VKLDKNQNVSPSKVIHIRNIPNEISEAEIIHLGIPFGRVTNVLVLKGKNQVRTQSSVTSNINFVELRHSFPLCLKCKGAEQTVNGRFYVELEHKDDDIWLVWQSIEGSNFWVEV